MIIFYGKKRIDKTDNSLNWWQRVACRYSVKLIALAIIILGVIGGQTAFADTPVSLMESFAGNINITGTAGTLRTMADRVSDPPNTDSCQVTNSGTMTLSGIPSGSTIVRAYLYWAGSGGDPQGGAVADYNVTLNGSNITAARTYTASKNIPDNNGNPTTNTIYYFQGVADVTSMVAATGNSTYTFSNLTVQTANVNNGGQYCAGSGVLSAFSLVVVYSNPSETMHVVNMWEGFQIYWGSSITLSPSNFTVPDPLPSTTLSGRHLVLTWEGDSGNSQARNGYSENLTFCAPAPCTGNALTDTYNPANQQFNSTVDVPPNGPFSGINTVWGSDLDMYDITTRLHAGDSSVTAVYSSGQDLVLLANQTMSIPNIPVSDLSITKSHSGDFTAGTNGSYTISVPNAGPSSTSKPITVTDTLPAGLTFVSGTGTGWSCSAVGQIVTCVQSGAVAVGATAPLLTINVSVAGAASPSVTNTATVSGGGFDNVSGNNTSLPDVTTVHASNLSTSTKSWQDLNGGDQDPGDIIRYTITLTESAGIAASGVSVTDSISTNLTNLTVQSIPVGAINSSTGTQLNITGISVPANGSVTIVFDVTIASVTAGTLINNAATVTNLSGTGATPSSSTITVSVSSIPGSGNKPLYLWRDGNTTGHLYRSPQGVSSNYVTVAKDSTVVSWQLSPVLQSAVTINSGGATIPVQLWLTGYGYGFNNTYSIPVTLRCGGTQISTVTRNVNLSGTATLFTFNLPAATATCAAGSYWRLDVQNNRGGLGDLLNAADLRVYPAPSTGNYSNVNLPSRNVINVDSISFYDAAYPNGNVITVLTPGQTVYVRANVSDPFGDYDINGALLTLTDPAGTVQLNAVTMSPQAESSPADAYRKTYQYQYPVPALAETGYWTARVVATEGTEGTVTDYGVETILLPPPVINVVKSANPTNASPGDIITYTIVVTNTGLGKSPSVVVQDSLSPYVQGGLSSYSGSAFNFIDGTTASGLTLGTPAYSSDNGATWTYAPSSGGGGAPAGYDGNISNWRIPMSGTMNANGAYFTINYKVRVE